MEDREKYSAKQQGCFMASLAESDNGKIEGTASVIGVMDVSSRVIFPGAFSQATLSRFVSGGAFYVEHETEELPVGYIEKASEVQGSIVFTACFHSDPEAQRARQVAMERNKAGKTIGMSIGWRSSWDQGDVMAFENGEALLLYAKEKGYNLNLFDQAAIRNRKSYVIGFLKIRDLNEVSMTMNPANRLAKATNIAHASEISGDTAETPGDSTENPAGGQSEHSAANSGGKEQEMSDTLTTEDRSFVQRLRTLLGGGAQTDGQTASAAPVTPVPAPLLAELQAANINDQAHLARVINEASAYRAEVEGELQKAAIRAFGAERGAELAKGFAGLPLADLKAKAFAWNASADKELGTDPEKPAQRATAPSALPTGVDAQQAASSKLWDKLTPEQQATGAKFATTDAAKESYAANLLKGAQ